MPKRGGTPITFSSESSSSKSSSYYDKNKRFKREEITEDDDKPNEITFLQPEILPLNLMLDELKLVIFLFNRKFNYYIKYLFRKDLYLFNLT